MSATQTCISLSWTSGSSDLRRSVRWIACCWALTSRLPVTPIVVPAIQRQHNQFRYLRHGRPRVVQRDDWRDTKCRVSGFGMPPGTIEASDAASYPISARLSINGPFSGTALPRWGQSHGLKVYSGPGVACRRPSSCRAEPSVNRR